MLRTKERSIPQEINERWNHLWSELQPSLVVTWREIIDTLRDWRIILPIVVLVTVFPFLANFAAHQGLGFVNKYGADLIIERLFPFLMLVVGFFPSTFSLVIALETFVGEKERHSLEPLLATPLTDTQLYVGKLLAATIPPILASYLGMVVYTLLLWFSLNWRPSLELLLISFALATTKAFVMVAGAVIVSSQSTSVRAANLVASFIIIPMAFLLQGEAGLLLFANYTALWWIVAFLFVVDILLIRLGVRIFDREHLLGRHIDHLDLKKAWRVFRNAVWPRQGIKALYLKEIPTLLKAIWPELLITAGTILIGGILIGLWGDAKFPLPAEAFDFEATMDREAIEQAVVDIGLLPSFSVVAIFVNNVRSLLLGGFLALFSMGVLAILLLMIPIAIIAYLTFQVGALGIPPWGFVATFVLPHGIFELPAAIVLTAQAMRMGDVILNPPEDGGGIEGIIREIGHFIKLLVALVAPLLLLAAWIETEITPQLVMDFVRNLG